jgi:PPOX class probable F420-dependent enzyme
MSLTELLSGPERAYLDAARVGRLATADAEGHPHAVPVCYASHDDAIVSPLDEKPKDAPPEELGRVRDVRANSHVALVVDHYTEAWDRLGWLQVRGRATVVPTDAAGHRDAVTALRTKYDQYASHALEERPLLRIEPGHAVSWGELTPDAVAEA